MSVCNHAGKANPFSIVGKLMTRAVFAMLLAILTPAVWAAQMCAAPGKDGSATLSGIVNDYFPGTANTVLKAGSTQLTLGTARTSAGGKSVAAGDLLLVIQMQDASINKSNSSAYGDGSGSGQGSTSVGNTGLYEFVTVTEVSGSGATTQVKFAPALTNTYTNAAAVADVSGQKTYQIVRVPQYTTATANGVYAPAWDGSTGGVVSMDVRDGLTLAAGTVENISNRAIFVGGKGFRGALGTAASSNGDKTRWAGNDNNPPGDGGKGEGIAGTPKRLVTKDLWAEKATSAATSGNLTSVVGSVEGYPLGSRGRGAPGNAGGGGNDGYQAGGNSNQNNSGGGGGGNYAPGGVGGRPWDFPLEDTAGRGGAGYMGTVAFSRVFLGGGGGAGGTNNSTGDTGTYSNNGVSCGAGALCSSGAAGGGVVILRAGSVSGTGVIDVRGANGYNVQQDAAGGGGAGGSVVIYSADGGSATVDASGGDGGNAWAGNTGGGSGQRHGPGGGGGGGFVAYAPTNFVLTATIKGGTPGYTTNGTTDNYGAEGNIGGIAAFQPPTVPGILPGAQCQTDLSLTKTNTGTTLVSGTTTTYQLTATNQGALDSSGTITVVDVLPSGMSVADGYVATSGAQGTNWSCNAASNVLTCTSATTIAGNGGSSVFGITVNVSAASGTGTVNKARIGGGGDPYKPTPDGGTASACTGNSMAAGCAVDADTVVAPLLSLSKTDGIDNLRAGAVTTYHLTVTNQGAVATSGTITVVDQLPSGTSFAGGSNTFNSSDGSFSCTYASASLSVTCTRTTSLGVNQSSVIDIPVTILATAPGAVINLAQVGGGGDPTESPRLF